MSKVSEGVEKAKAYASDTATHAAEAVRDTATQAADAVRETASHAAEAVRETAGTAKVKAGEAIGATKAKASAAYESTKAKAGEAYEATKVKAGDAVAASKRGAATASRKAGETVQDNPLTVLIGGIALGALAGALLPKTKREDEYLGDVGRRVNKTATDAAKAARAAGVEQLDALGINKDAARSQISTLVDGVVKAAGTASSAAAKKVTSTE